MTTSGTATFNLDLADIVQDAYERIGIDPNSGYQFASARRSLSLILNDWSNRGIKVWTVDEGTVSVTSGTSDYTLPADTVDLIEHKLRTGTGTSQFDYNLGRIGVSDYSSITNKNQTGRPTQIYIDRQVGSTTATLWPVPDTSYTLVYWRLRRIEDPGSPASNTADVLPRYLTALIAALAADLAEKNPGKVDLQRAVALAAKAEQKLMEAGISDRSRSPLKVSPRKYGR